MIAASETQYRILQRPASSPPERSCSPAVGPMEAFQAMTHKMSGFKAFPQDVQGPAQKARRIHETSYEPPKAVPFKSMSETLQRCRKKERSRSPHQAPGIDTNALTARALEGIAPVIKPYPRTALSRFTRKAEPLRGSGSSKAKETARTPLAPMPPTGPPS